MLGKFSHIICLSMVIFSQTMLVAQDYKKDILSVYNNFLTQKNYSVTIKYNMYLNKETVKPYQSREVQLSKSNKSLYLKENNGVETLNNEKYSLFINHKKKMLSAVKRDKNEEANMPKADDLFKLFDGQMDSLFLVFEKIKLVSESESSAKYECEAKKNFPIVKIWIEIDKKKHIYKSVRTLYANPIEVKEFGDKKNTLTMEVIYDGYKTNVTYPDNFFDEKKFISENAKGKIELKQNYKSYELLTSN